MGGRKNFWPPTWGSEINNPWSRGGIYCFRHMGVRIQFSFIKKCLTLWGVCVGWGGAEKIFDETGES